MPNVKVELRTLYCRKTTENGHDEVYLIVGGTHGDGSHFDKLCPGGTGDADGGQAWDFNDSGDKQDRWLRYTVYTAPLGTGRSASIHIVFMESDGSNYGEALQVAGQVAVAAGGNPSLATVGSLINATGLLQNRDDCLGALDLVLQNDGGKLRWTYSFNGSHYTDHSPDIPANPSGAPNLVCCHLRNVDGGDGDYDAYLTITMSN